MPDPTDELRALRERAYGPGADIAGDPAAVERLRELEAAASVPVPSVATPDSAIADADDPSPSTGSIASPGESSAEPAGPSDAEDDIVAPDDEPAAAVRRRPRPVVLGAIALVLALLVGAAIAYGALQLRPGSVATLTAAPDAAWPEFLGEQQEGAMVFEDFLGLTVAIVPQPWGGQDDVPCLFVLNRTGASGITSVGCGAGGFAPTAALAVTATFPDTLISEYPVGTALQFVLDDGEVTVYADRG